MVGRTSGDGGRVGVGSEAAAAPCPIGLSPRVRALCLGALASFPQKFLLFHAHNVTVSLNNGSCRLWLHCLPGNTIFHSTKQSPVCPGSPYGYYGGAILTHITNYSKKEVKECEGEREEVGLRYERAQEMEGKMTAESFKGFH